VVLPHLRGGNNGAGGQAKQRRRDKKGWVGSQLLRGAMTGKPGVDFYLNAQHLIFWGGEASPGTPKGNSKKEKTSYQGVVKKRS